MSMTTKVQSTLDWARSKPSLTNVLGNPVTGLGGNAIPVRIANKVVQQMLLEPFAWKWNRRVPAPFVLNQLQQDYSTSITDLGWVENCIRRELNNPQYAPPNPPDYPIRGVEVVRELLPTSTPGLIAQLCAIPNSEAMAGTWAPNTLFQNPAIGTELPAQPLLQIWDPNGNLQVLTTFGQTGSVAPTWNTAPNGTTADGTCVWTMADPNGITWRVGPLPPQSGNVYQIQPYYQKKPSPITAVSQVWPLPDELSDVFETGFTAYAWEAAENDRKFEATFALFQSLIKKAVRGGDREAESFCMYPGRSITGVTGTMNKGDETYPPGLFSNY